MPASQNYTWESTHTSFSSSDPSRRLKGWLMMALVASFIAHGALWVWFTKTTLPEGVSSAVEVLDKTRTFKVERVTINDAVVEDRRSQDEAAMVEILDADAAPLVKEIDEDDPNMYDKLPEHEIRLTSAVDDMSKFMASERPTLKGENNELADTLAPEDVFSTEELEETIEAMKSRNIPLAAQQSDLQMTINLDEDDPGFLDGNDLESMNLAMAKAAGNANITQGFSNLDDLLNRTGPLLDGTKPILIPTDLLFQFNQAELQESARLSMMKLGLLIKRNQESRFIIEGHTDTLGSDEYNMNLSLERAQSVHDWLVDSLGLGQDRVSVRGYGETRPLVPTGDQFAQAINRRVEIAIRPAG